VRYRRAQLGLLKAIPDSRGEFLEGAHAAVLNGAVMWIAVSYAIPCRPRKAIVRGGLD